MIMTGFPLKVIEQKQIPVSSWIQSSSLPILVIQNNNDPVGSYEDVKLYLSKVPNNDTINFLETTGDTHDYINFDLLNQQVIAFLA